MQRELSGLTLRDVYSKRLEQLRSERSSWEPAWRDITEQMVPYGAVWDKADRNSGSRKDGAIINNTPVTSLRTLSAGLMAGITSPARRWFGLTVEDRDLANQRDVKMWLDIVQRTIEAALHVSSWYPVLANATYPHLGSIGTSAIFEEELPGGRIIFRSLPIGQYFLDHNSEEEVDTCYRELTYTTRQMVQKFGLKQCSEQVRAAYDRGDYNRAWDIVHAIFPNDEYDRGKIGYKGMRFKSCWWEPNEPRKEHFLRVSGYREFPILTPRWSRRPGDVYGRGPGWEVVADCRVLQYREKRQMQMVDKIVNPPMRGTGNIRRASLLPGDLTEIPGGQGGTYEPALTIAPQAVVVMRESIEKDESRIETSMFVDLWRTLLDDNRNQRATATEIDATRQEKMLMMGPLLENLDDDLLDPAIERTFQILDRQGAFPPPPEDLQGAELKVDFISIMHQMQQAIGLTGLRTFVMEAASLGSVKPAALDNIDEDVIVNEYAKITGVRPDAVLDKKKVEDIRAQRAEQMQAQQEGQQMLEATEGAKNLSGVDSGSLSGIAEALSPAAAAQGGALG